MRKTLLLLSFYLIFCVSTVARQINIDEASLIARQFTGNSSLKTSSGKNAALKLAHKEGAKDATYYYVFNRGTDAGYVIVAGDDRVDGVLGYADSGSFDEKNIPENMKCWLSSYADQIKYAIDNNITASETALPKAATSVAPLLGDTKWNQGDPYNMKAPIISGYQAPTGCVATAMAQIMYYHKYPEKGVGSKSLNVGGTTYTADFANTTYDWNNMLPQYNSQSSSQSKNAVATLMLHCGIAADMSYDVNESGAQTTDACTGLISYFNYDKGMRYIQRNYYSRTEWEKILKAELDSKRPIMYGGNSQTGGHQFVCDGYDTNGMFHINWGWGGMSDGYFKIAVLTPSGQGIGGSTGGYNYNQDAVIGIQKPVSGSIAHPYEMVVREVTASDATQDLGTFFMLYLSRLFNSGYGNFSGFLGVGFKNSETGAIDAVHTLGRDFSLKAMNYYNTYNLTAEIPTTLKGTKYRIIPMSKSSDSNEWEEIKSEIGTSKIQMTISGNTAIISQISNAPKLTVSNVKIEQAFSGVNFNVDCDVTNTGDEYYSAFRIQIYDSSNNHIYGGSDLIENVIPGESMTLTFTENFTAPAGDYFLTITDNNSNQLCAPVKFTLNANQGPANLTLKSMRFDNANNVPKDNFAIHATITNTGGYFKNKIRAFIFPKVGGSSLTFIDGNCSISKDETKEVTISGTLDLENNTYGAVMYYFSETWDKFYPSSKNWITFTLTDPSGVELTATANEAITVFPNPAESIVNIKAQGEVSAVRIFDLNGRMIIEQHDTTTIDVSNLATGTYIVQAVVDGKATITPLIKK